MRRLLQIILLMNLVFPQGLLPGTYKMAAIDFDTTSFKGLKSNSISDIVPLADTLVWLGTGAGLAVLRDTSSIFTITSNAAAAAGQLSNERLRVVSPLWQQVKKHYLRLLPQRYRTPLLGMDLFIPQMQLGIQSTGLILISQWIWKGIH